MDFDNQAGNHILILGEDRSINILNLEFNKIEATHKLKHEISGGFFCPSLSQSDNILSVVVSDIEGNITILDYNTTSHTFSQSFQDCLKGKISSFCHHEIETLAFGLVGSNEWFIYDLQFQKLLYKGYLENATCLSVHPDGHIIGITDSENKIHFIDLSQNEEILVFQSNIVTFYLFNLVFNLFRLE